MDKLDIILEFPRLAAPAQFEITSKRTQTYNCIAWAAGEDKRKWWPDKMKVHYWPKGILREPSLPAFMSAFAAMGYKECEDEHFEAGFEKIAIFTKASKPTHAARQLANGKWTSKLGDEEDIEHELRGVEGLAYGEVRKIMKRPLNSC